MGVPSLNKASDPLLRASRRRVAVLLAASLVGLAGAGLLLRNLNHAADVRKREVRVLFNVPYRTVDGQMLALDVYEPPPGAGSGPFPVVLLIHGGGWTEGSRNQMRGFARALALRGIVAASADYRLVSRDGTRNRWPAQINDVRAAVSFLRQPAQTARFHLWAGGRVGVMGHSSGAHLACLMGVQNPRQNGVGAVVDFAGPVDLTDAAHPPLSQREMPLLPRLFGKTCTNAPNVYHNASPACLVQKDAVPFLIFHGGDDLVVPPQQARRMEAALREKNVPVRLIMPPGEGHLFGKPENVALWVDQSALFLKAHLP